jgi:hypothetical protein
MRADIFAEPDAATTIHRDIYSREIPPGEKSTHALAITSILITVYFYSSSLFTCPFGASAR